MKLLLWIVLACVPGAMLVADALIREFYVMPRAVAQFRASVKETSYVDGKVQVPRSTPTIVLELSDVIGETCGNGQFSGCYAKDKYPQNAEIYYFSSGHLFKILSECHSGDNCTYSKTYNVYSWSVPSDKAKAIEDEAAKSSREDHTCGSGIIWHYNFVYCDDVVSQFGYPLMSLSSLTVGFPWYNKVLEIDTPRADEISLRVNYVYGSVDVSGPSGKRLSDAAK